MSAHDPTIRDHKAWLGYVQQEGLVVSPSALVDAQVVLDRNTLPMQERFLPFVKEVAPDGEDPLLTIADFPAFARGFLQWPEGCLHGFDSAQPSFDGQKRLIKSNHRYRDKWLANVKRDLHREPDRIRQFYQVASLRIEPVDLACLWPVSG